MVAGAPSEQFERLVREQARVLAAAVRRVCGRRHGALVPDIEQEVRIALWKRLQQGGEIRHPTAYVHKTALTTALAVVKRLRREEQLPEERDDPAPRDPPGPSEMAPVEKRRWLEEVLARLEEDPRRALSAYLAGFNHREVAELYGWTESRARHLIYRTLDRLRERMQEGGDGEPSW